MTATTQGRRGAVGMSLITLVMLVVLLSLGVWQLQRRQEKHVLIAALTERLAAAPVTLPAKAAWSSLTAENDEFRRVFFSVRRDAGSEANDFAKPDAQVFASGSALRPDVSGIGTWDFAPLQLAPDETVVVNRGFVADGRQASSLPASGVNQAPVFTGYIRFPEKPGSLTPHEDLGKRLWFVRDHQSMARGLGWGNVAPFYIDLESPIPPSGWPKPGPLEAHLRDQHLQYAVTWFALAGVVAAAFIVWLLGQRRGR